MKATYAKLRDGSWGLRIEGSAQPGQSVQATRRDGVSTTKVVGEIVFVNANEGITLARIQEAPRKVFRRPCGYPGCTGGRSHCDECS